VLLRRSADYEHFAKSLEFNAEDLSERVEEQHRCVIDDLRTGELDAEIAAAVEREVRAAGIEVKLLNPQSWLTGGTISLDLEVVCRADRLPEAGVQLAAFIEGAGRDELHVGTSDEKGRAKIEFAIPALGKGDLTLVIQGSADSGREELRFAMRSKPKMPAAGGTS
jgi:hypothetical protein